MYGIACGNVVPSAPSKTQEVLQKQSDAEKEQHSYKCKLKCLGEDRAVNLTVSSAGGKRISRSSTHTDHQPCSV